VDTWEQLAVGCVNDSAFEGGGLGRRRRADQQNQTVGLIGMFYRDSAGGAFSTSTAKT